MAHKAIYLSSRTPLLSCDLLCSYKGEGVVGGGLQDVWKCLKPVPNGLRVKWDDNVKKFELLEQITEVWPFFSSDLVPINPTLDQGFNISGTSCNDRQICKYQLWKNVISDLILIFCSRRSLSAEQLHHQQQWALSLHETLWMLF